MFWPYHTPQKDGWKRQKEGTRKGTKLSVDVVSILQIVANQEKDLKFGTSMSVTRVTRIVRFQTGLLFFLASCAGE